MRFKFIFLRMRPTSDFEIESTCSRVTALSANKRTVQRAYPSGALLQAKLVILASAKESMIGGRPGRFLSVKKVRPLWLYFRAQMEIVFGFILMIWATSLKDLPSSSSSKARARLNFLALVSPF